MEELTNEIDKSIDESWIIFSKSLRFLPVLFNLFFGLIYSFGDQDRPWTTLGAFEVVLTGPDAIRVVEAWQALLDSLITGVCQKAVSLDNGCRT